MGQSPLGLSTRRIAWIAMAATSALGARAPISAEPAIRAPLAAAEASAPARNLLLVTLDTARADALGSGATPEIDRLAARGTRYRRAIAPAPLTLPAHATLLTGLEPPEHGLHDNGAGALPADLPTLATVLAAHGFATAAVIGSRVLDRRFGLARGFAEYDDRMLSERTGEHGDAERPAAEVVDRALAWLRASDASRPFFLWLHFYDPHFPYAAVPFRGAGGVGGAAGQDPSRADYLGELAAVDRELARLFAGLGDAGARTLVAVVGDHGEALGEHGEATHGLFLYRGVLEVPLVLAGPGIPAGRTVEGTVATRRLAATLLDRLALPAGGIRGPILGGLAAGAGTDGDDLGVRSETHLPQTAYGWSPLVAWTRGGYRFVRAPRAELYAFATDAAEKSDLYGIDRRRAAQLARELEAAEGTLHARSAAPVAADAELAAALAALGYLSGASGAARDALPAGLDPKDGLPLLERFDRAGELVAFGDLAGARALLEELVRRSPASVPFLSELGRVRLRAGDALGAIAPLAEAARPRPELEAAHLNLADALSRAGRDGDAEKELRVALGIDPRSARALLAYAALLERTGRGAEAEALLDRAASDGVASAGVAERRVRQALARQRFDAAEARAQELLRLAGETGASWLLAGEVAVRRGELTEAMRRYGRAARLAPNAPEPFLAAGRLLARRGEIAAARRELERAAALGRGTAPGEEAARLLAALAPN